MRSVTPAPAVSAWGLPGSAFSALFVVLLLTTYYLLPTVSYAADFTVTPAVIDGKGKLRDILKYSTTIENTAKRMISVYPWVTDLDIEAGQVGKNDLGGGGPADDRAGSLARWIEVTRGVIDMMPGDKKDIPILIQVPPGAKPGIYHALVHLSEGGNRAVAEANPEGTVDIAINIEVLEDVNERMQMSLFGPMKNYFFDDSASFTFNVENIGNRGLIPGGKIRIYDGRGKEVAEVPANKENKRLEPSEKAALASVWAAGDSFGRYKAKIELEYGARGTLEDTTYFWVLPWQKLAGMFTVLIAVSVIAALLLHARAVSVPGVPHYTPEYVEELVESVRRGHKFAGARITKSWEEEPQYPPYDKPPVSEQPLEESPSRIRSWVDNAKSRMTDPFGRRNATESGFGGDDPYSLVEVDIPPPVRTSGKSRLARSVDEMAIASGHTVELYGPPPSVVHPSHKVHLPARPKPAVNPRHVLKLESSK